VAVFLLLFFLASIPLFLIEWIIGKCNPGLRDRSSLRIVQGAITVIAFLSGVRTTVIGEENIPKDTPVLYIGNHRSYFDVVLTYARVRGLTGYIAKEELAKIPFLRTWMKLLHCHFLNRTDIRQGLKTILDAIEDVKNGISIFIFPEGTRSTSADETEMLPFREGSFKIATKTGCPVIPVAISHSSEILEDHMPFIRATHVTIEYGTPIYPDQLSRQEQKFLGKYVQNIIQEALVRNH
jgi:1-acyl-sn-glycerol-3-phosphate acyltransferase